MGERQSYWLALIGGWWWIVEFFLTAIQKDGIFGENNCSKDVSIDGEYNKMAHRLSDLIQLNTVRGN